MQRIAPLMIVMTLATALAGASYAYACVGL